MKKIFLMCVYLVSGSLFGGNLPDWFGVEQFNCYHAEQDFSFRDKINELAQKRVEHKKSLLSQQEYEKELAIAKFTILNEFTAKVQAEVVLNNEIDYAGILKCINKSKDHYIHSDPGAHAVFLDGLIEDLKLHGLVKESNTDDVNKIDQTDSTTNYSSF